MRLTLREAWYLIVLGGTVEGPIWVPMPAFEEVKWAVRNWALIPLLVWQHTIGLIGLVVGLFIRG